MQHFCTSKCLARCSSPALFWSKASLANRVSNYLRTLWRPFPWSLVSLGYWQQWPRPSFPYSADLRSFGVNGNRGAGSPEMLAKTSCSFLKLQIPLPNWNGLYIFGIKYKLALPLPLQDFGGKNVLWSGISRASLEGRLQPGFPILVVLSFGKCHPTYRQSPWQCWHKHGQTTPPSFLLSWL